MTDLTDNPLSVPQAFCHGTALSHFSQIDTFGLRPLCESALSLPLIRVLSDGNWRSRPTLPNRKLVYLALPTPLVLFFALRACVVLGDEYSIIVFVDPGFVDTSKLRVDEHFRARELYGSSSRCPKGVFNKLRAEAHEDARWQESLIETGACSHLGSIPRHALTFSGPIAVNNSVFYRDWMFDQSISHGHRITLFDYWTVALQETARRTGRSENELLETFDLSPSLREKLLEGEPEKISPGFTPVTEEWRPEPEAERKLCEEISRLVTAGERISP